MDMRFSWKVFFKSFIVYFAAAIVCISIYVCYLIFFSDSERRKVVFNRPAIVIPSIDD
jgi:hypothetical protein